MMKKTDLISKAADALTLLRIVFALCLLALPAFSMLFWVFYTLGGLTDIADGAAARAHKSESRHGELLDSIADLLFITVCVTVLLINLRLPIWLLLFGAVTAAVKLSAYILQYFREGKYSSKHTFLNKLTGAVLFFSPLVWLFFGLTAAGITASAIAFGTALFELLSQLYRR